MRSHDFPRPDFKEYEKLTKRLHVSPGEFCPPERLLRGMGERTGNPGVSPIKLLKLDIHTQQTILYRKHLQLSFPANRKESQWSFLQKATAKQDAEEAVRAMLSNAQAVFTD